MINSVIISDIHNEPAAGCHLYAILAEHSTVKWLSLSQLAGVSGLLGDELHRYLIGGGGFQRAVDTLLDEVNIDIAIGFSAGGSVLWRACLAGLICPYVFCLSSTRIREEVRQPDASCHIYLGGNDSVADIKKRFAGVTHIIDGENHNAYLVSSSQMSKKASYDIREAIAELVANA